jgi:hypothetical protein
MRLHPLTQSYGCPTTRRYPRSLAQAFPQDHAEAIEHHPSAKSWLLADMAIAALFVGVLAALMFGVFA